MDVRLTREQAIYLIDLIETSINFEEVDVETVDRIDEILDSLNRQAGVTK